MCRRNWDFPLFPFCTFQILFSLRSKWKICDKFKTVSHYIYLKIWEKKINRYLSRRETKFRYNLKKKKLNLNGMLEDAEYIYRSNCDFSQAPVSVEKAHISLYTLYRCLSILVFLNALPKKKRTYVFSIRTRRRRINHLQSKPSEKKIVQKYFFFSERNFLRWKVLIVFFFPFRDIWHPRIS